MAKKITDETQAATAVSETPPAQEPAQQIVEAPKAPAPEEPQPKESKKATAEKPQTVIPDHADKILKAFPNYPELYIDFSGGTYTVDTPPSFRSNATLYTNPYFKS